ncbi:hypothetical protein [Pseudomonas syringae]|uniref:hypothetical protein n=1 Tax=Pseudomonas syringae TaxID=317 RepID=UPI001F1871F0|nr:hypothetical protein [Pseudomonas syringae]MCF5371940.1 hypothetical protein [Pseudomonas syringae]MCF5382516.1 hypothetical protein [Pseudomonas syringae]MCF5419403.1 hypothetical protein [Pseudomonas syringae]MCF5451950.1 hypothetical protein [Pseudomonas syringae]MCF5458734.1 hypothetical protein [Pseudomonas syringae]
MTKAQIDAIKQLEVALLACKRSGLALVGIDGSIFATVADSAFKAQCRSQSSCEAMLNRSNEDHTGTVKVETHDVYLDSGAA